MSFHVDIIQNDFNLLVISNRANKPDEETALPRYSIVILVDRYGR